MNHDRLTVDSVPRVVPEQKGDGVDDMNGSVMSGGTYIVYPSDDMAFDEIHKMVEHILRKANQQQKEELFGSKKYIRRMVAKELQISRKKYKHIIDKCARECALNLQQVTAQ